MPLPRGGPEDVASVFMSDGGENVRRVTDPQKDERILKDSVSIERMVSSRVPSGSRLLSKVQQPQFGVP